MTIVTDHKFLLAILSEGKGIPQLAAPGLQRWAIILPGYNNSNADCLRQFPKDCENDSSKLVNSVFLTDLVESAVTSLDPIINRVIH